MWSVFCGCVLVTTSVHVVDMNAAEALGVSGSCRIPKALLRHVVFVGSTMFAARG